MGNYNGFADEIIKSEIREHYPHDKLLILHDPDSDLEKVKYSELCNYRGNGLPIGSEYINGELIYYLRPYEHTMINGISGGGKTTVFYENFFLCMAAFPDDKKSTMIYSDYKHDVLKKHKSYLLNHGYHVLTLDLLEPIHSNTWNPLEGQAITYIAAKNANDEKALLEVDQFVQGLGNSICPTPPDVRDPMWSNGARDYICALIYVLFDLAAKGFIRHEDVTFENIQGLHKFIRAFWMQERSNLGNGVLTLTNIANLKPFALLGETFTKSDYVSAFMTVLGCGSITGSSYMAVIESALGVLCDQSIMRVTRSSMPIESIDFEKILEKPTFVCITTSGTPGSNILISMFFDRLFDFVRTKTAHEPLKRSLHVLLDEVCNMHRIDNLCTYISTTRSMKAYFHLGVQSDSMLAAKYGDFNAINLKNNTTEFFFGSNEKTTLNRFVSQGGETTALDINFRLGMSDHIAFKTYNVVTTSDLSIIPLGNFYVRQARHMLLKSSMVPSFAVKEFQNSEAVQENQEENIPVSKKLDFSRLENNRECKKADKDEREEARKDSIEEKRRALMEVLERSQKPVNQPQDDQHAMYIKALWACIKSGNVSMSFIQRKLSMGYNLTGEAIEWMEKNGFITSYPNCEVKITKEEFIEKFGNPDEETLSAEDERQRYIEERRRALMERLKAIEDKEEDDEESDGKNDEDDGVDDEDEMSKHLIPLLVACFEQSMRETGIDGKNVLTVNDTSSFELQFINNGQELRISDRGETLKKVSQSKRKIKNLLKGYAPVALDGEVICVEIKNPSDLFKTLLTLYAAIDAAKKLK